MKRYFACFTFVVTLFLGPNNQLFAAPQASIKVGALLPLTGDLAMQGAAFREGIEIAVESINSAGGVNEAMMEAIFEDTHLSPSQTHRAAKKLLELDEVVVGLVSTFSETKAAGPLFESRKVPLICLWDSAPVLEEMGDYVFGIGTWTPSTGNTIAKYAANVLKAERAAIMNNNDEWSLTVSDAFSKQFQELKGKVVFSESFNPEDSDFRSAISKMMLEQPDILFAPIGHNVVSFFRQLKQQRYEGAIFEADNLNDELIQAAGDTVEGVYQTQSADPKGEMFKLFARRYKQKFGKEPSLGLYSAWGYDAIQLVARAIRASGATPEDIKQNLYRIKDYNGASGRISIGAEGSSRVPVSLFRVQGGKLVEVEDR